MPLTSEDKAKSGGTAKGDLGSGASGSTVSISDKERGSGMSEMGSAELSAGLGG